MTSKKIIILAGGLGTRLKSVVSNVPKPWAPINNRPFIEYLLSKWVTAGFNSFFFLLHHQAEVAISYINSYKSSLLKGMNVKYLVEDSPLGTGGAIANAVNKLKINDSFFVTNADTWLENADSFYQNSKIPSLAIIYVKDTNRYGRVIVRDNLVERFIEKDSLLGEGWINAGMYHLNSSFFIDWDGQAFSMETKLLPQLVEQKLLKAFPIETNFIDIGIPDDYRRFENLIINQFRGIS